MSSINNEIIKFVESISSIANLDEDSNNDITNIVLDTGAAHALYENVCSYLIAIDSYSSAIDSSVEQAVSNFANLVGLK